MSQFAPQPHVLGLSWDCPYPLVALGSVVGRRHGLNHTPGQTDTEQCRFWIKGVE